MLSVGKHSLTHIVFHPQLGSHKNRHWAWIIPYREVRESTELVLDLSSPVGIFFSVSNSVCAPLFCLSCALYTPGQLHSSSVGRGQGPSAAAWDGVYITQGWLPRETNWSRGTNTHNWSWSCYVSSLCEALFHPLLDCIVFSLETQIPRYSWQNCSHFYSWW